jgi:hypothetical protein
MRINFRASTLQRCAILAIAIGLSVPAHAAAPGVLDHTLGRLARVAELYRDTALGFTCEETISYSGQRNGQVRFAYLLTKDKHGKLGDFRTWSSSKSGKAVDPRDYKVPRFLESAYLWAFIFRADRQPLYKFALGETEEGDDPRVVVVILFGPRGPLLKGLNDWVGSARIDRETSQILSVTAFTPDDWNRRVAREREIVAAPTRDVHEDRKTYEIERIVTVFGFVKNGMRFPSHVEITMTHSSIAPGTRYDEINDYVVRKVTQDYKDFEFFSVRSSEEISGFVNGDKPLSPPR